MNHHCTMPAPNPEEYLLRLCIGVPLTWLGVVLWQCYLNAHPGDAGPQPATPLCCHQNEGDWECPWKCADLGSSPKSFTKTYADGK